MGGTVGVSNGDTPERRPALLSVRFGIFEADLRNCELRKQGIRIRLHRQPFAVLQKLLEHPGEIVTREALKQTLWADDTFVDFEHGLNKAINRLREALGDNAENPLFIETLPRRGYRFLAEVKKLDRSAAPSVEVLEIRSSSVAPRDRRWWQNSLTWITLLGLLLLVAGVGVFWRFNASRNTTLPIRSIAVLPLENLSGDPEQEYFADGMTDELITNLAQIHSIRVISRTSVVQFKHTKKTLPEIAVALNVDAVVEGSVSRAGTNVHIRAQLIDARQDRHLWAETYERQISDILGLQTQVAKAIADQVKVKLTQQEDARLTNRPPRNPASYDALLRGLFLVSKRNRDATRLKKAIAYFEQAVSIDPKNAEAWAALGDAYGSLGGDYGAENPEVMRPKAHDAIAKALELDPNLADAYVASGWLKMFDWDEVGAERDFQRAIELNPNNSAAHRRYAFYLNLRNRFDDALKENRRAIDLAPLDIMPQALLALIYEDAGLADKALEQAQRVLELDPNYTSEYIRIGNAYSKKGQWAEALAAYEHVKETDRLGYLYSVASMWAIAGNRRQAEAAMASLKKFSKQNYVSPLFLASYEAKFGHREVALQWLEKAYQERDLGMLGLANDDDFASLRSDPRFQDLVGRVASR